MSGHGVRSKQHQLSKLFSLISLYSLQSDSATRDVQGLRVLLCESANASQMSFSAVPKMVRLSALLYRSVGRSFGDRGI